MLRAISYGSTLFAKLVLFLVCQVERVNFACLRHSVHLSEKQCYFAAMDKSHSLVYPMIPVDRVKYVMVVSSYRYMIMRNSLFVYGKLAEL